VSGALGFDECWRRVDRIPGWLTKEQARALWAAAGAVPVGGRLLEIGSHQGRSTIVLGTAARTRNATVVAVDPHRAGGRFGGPLTRDRFRANVATAGLDGVVRLLERKSTELRREWHEPLDLLYVDGKHDYWTVGDDLRWGEHLTPGAPLLLHDAFSSIGVTLAVVRHLLPSRRLRYLDRVGSLARFEVAPPTRRDRVRLVAQLPWFARNLVVKIALRVTRLFGGTRPDPF